MSSLSRTQCPVLKNNSGQNVWYSIIVREKGAAPNADENDAKTVTKTAGVYRFRSCEDFRGWRERSVLAERDYQLEWSLQGGKTNNHWETQTHARAHLHEREQGMDISDNRADCKLQRV